MGRETGSLIGDYRLIRAIGSGAAGKVFQAEHVITRRIEAIKLLPMRVPGDVCEEQALLREIEIQASLDHPNIASVHNAFRVPEGLALVMEFAGGEPLSTRLSQGPISLREGAPYILQTLDALAYAHERRVVHGDVKPSNIVIAADGSVKLTDFGLARAMDDAAGSAAPGGIAGSPFYMSPEQVLGLEPADPRSDCYSAGVILFEIAAGQRPFEGQSAFDVMLQHREAAPPAPVSLEPRIGSALNAVILRALEKEPGRRFQSAAEFRCALEAALARCPAMRMAGSRRPHRRRFGTFAWAGVGIGTVALLSAALLPSFHRRPLATHPGPKPPAALPPMPKPQAAATPVEPIITETKPIAAEPLSTAPPPPRNKPAARRQPKSDAGSAVHVFVRPEPEPEPTAAAAAATPPMPPPPDVAGTPSMGPAGQPALETIVPPNSPSEPPKHHGLLRRAFGRIAHPWSRKP